VHRLIKALAHEHFDFYIHLDKRADMQEFAQLAGLPHVYFIQKRRWARWATYRFTEATLQGIREILATGTKYDFINLLSDQDYPVKSATSIHDFFAHYEGCSFLSFEPPGSKWWDQAKARVEQYHLNSFEFKCQYKLQNLLNSLLPKRQFPLPYTLYGGPCGTWWTITTDCAAYLVQFMDSHAALRRFSLFTWGSDEFLLTTILMNSPFKDRIVNNNYRYIDWSGGGLTPKTLTVEDADKLTHTHKLFARIFDANRDPEILNVIDQSLHAPAWAISA
jgi:hypothetical protein